MQSQRYFRCICGREEFPPQTARKWRYWSGASLSHPNVRICPPGDYCAGGLMLFKYWPREAAASDMPLNKLSAAQIFQVDRKSAFNR